MWNGAIEHAFLIQRHIKVHVIEVKTAPIQMQFQIEFVFELGVELLFTTYALNMKRFPHKSSSF